jgi:muconolactone D-isomerase
MDHLVTMTTQVPDGVTDAAVAAVRGREAAHTAELARAGRVLRLWRPPLRPGEWRTLGLFTADGAEELLGVWRTDTATPLLAHPTVDTVPLSAHPDDRVTAATVESGTS